MTTLGMAFCAVILIAAFAAGWAAARSTRGGGYSPIGDPDAPLPKAPKSGSGVAPSPALLGTEDRS